MTPPDGAQTAHVPAPVATAVDALLEASVVGSFSRLGPAVRRRVAGWTDPVPVPGRSVLVTGATSGLGLVAATRLAGLGATVCLVGRDPDRLDRARHQVAEAAGAGPAGGAGPEGVTAELADLGDADQVRQLGDRLAQRMDRLDVLVHNAGALLRRRQASPQGTELTLAVSLVAPFILTDALLERLAAARPSRVITVTSGGMYTQRFRPEELEHPPDAYNGVTAYARAKRAQVELTHAWQRHYGPRGVDFHSVHPGWADTPGLAEGLPAFSSRLHRLLRSPEDGADTLVWLAAGPPGWPPGGRLWLDRRPRSEHRLPWTLVGGAHRARDQDALWGWLENRASR